MKAAVALLPVLLSLALVACGSVEKGIEDRTKLEGPAKGDLGRELAVVVSGATPELASDLVSAMSQDLEGGDLFEEVAAERADAVAPVGTEARAARLTLDVSSASAGRIHDLIHQRDAWVVRYDLECALTDRSGACVLSGPVSGIGYDDVTDPETLSEAKRRDIGAAARRDAAMKIGRLLRRAAFERGHEAEKGLQRIHLPAGVGPVPVAVLGFDDDPSAKRRRGVALARALAGALQRLGPDIKVASQDEVEAELSSLSTSRPKSFERLRIVEQDALISMIGVRVLYIVGNLAVEGDRVIASASLETPRRGALAEIGRVRASADGPGAVGLVAVDLARGLGELIEKNPPSIPSKKDEDDDWMPKKKEEKEKSDKEKAKERARDE